MNASDIEQQVTEFVRDQFAVSPNDARFGVKTRLFEDGYVDSVGLAELLEFLNQAFGVDLPDEDLLSPEFDTIEGIARTVARRRAEK